MKKFFQTCFLLTVFVWSTPGASEAFAQTSIYKAPVVGPAAGTQRIALTCRAIINNTAPVSGTVNVTIPFPIDDEVQTVERYSFSSAMTPEKLLSIALKSDSVSGNRTLQIEVLDPSPGEEFVLEWVIVRREKSNPLGVPFKTNALIAPADKRFLTPNGTVPVDGEFSRSARAWVMPKMTRDEAIETIYRHFLTAPNLDPLNDGKLAPYAYTLEPHASALSALACSSVVGLARVVGIPAKMEIGYLIPTDRDEGEIGGTRAWANLYHPQRGWVPMDIFEAERNKGFAEYYLGHIGSDHITFAVGDKLNSGSGSATVAISDDSPRIATGWLKMQLSFKRLPLVERTIKSGEAQKENRSEIKNQDFN